VKFTLLLVTFQFRWTKHHEKSMTFDPLQQILVENPLIPQCQFRKTIPATRSSAVPTVVGIEG
jgi:hypothetical protein